MSYREALMILGVSEPYDMIELKKAYREKAKAFHPDINSSDVNNNTKMMQLVNEAYSVIKNSNQSHKEKDNDQVPKEKDKWSKFSQQEKEIIKRLCAELDILEMDAALEYENAKREGFLGTFVDWLNFKVEQFHKFMDNYDQIEELVKQIDEYKNVSFRYIVDIYLREVENGYDGSIVDLLKEKIEIQNLCQRLGKSKTELIKEYRRESLEKEDLTFREWIKEKSQFIKLCDEAFMNPLLTMNEFIQFKSFNQYSGTINDWLKQKILCKKYKCCSEELLTKIVKYYSVNGLENELEDIIASDIREKVHKKG